jgi:predicted ATPase
MIRQLSLQNFKCFGSKVTLPLAPINLLYGLNGRGKSTVSQSLLLLAQTMIKCDNVDNLDLQGQLISMGTCAELLNVDASATSFTIELQGDAPEEKVSMTFEAQAQRPLLARLRDFIVNGVSLVDTQQQGTSAVSTSSLAHVASAGYTSDVLLLQNLKRIQYVSAGRLGPRNTSPRNDLIPSDQLGVDGSYVINVLERQGADFQHEVQTALSEIMQGATLQARSLGQENIELLLNSVDGNRVFRPMHVGFGYSYVLPILVAALLAPPHSLLIVENPEAHLHPGAQSRLMSFLLRQAQSRQFQLILESHSDHIVNGLRIAVRKGELAPSEVGILYFEHEATQTQPRVVPIRCDCQGNLDQYPDDFLDEWTKQMVELI